jgi:salicylate hydroxylase
MSKIFLGSKVAVVLRVPRGLVLPLASGLDHCCRFTYQWLWIRDPEQINDMKALIVGGGIGGTTAALALNAAGWQVEVLEQAAAITEVGAGIQLSPNGIRVLEALGVMPALEATVYQPETLSLRHGRSGREIFSIPVKQIAERRWGARYLQVHRADMLEALKTTLESQVPYVFRLNSKVAGYSQTTGKATVHLADGRAIDADLVVGADGIHSAIRTQMIGQDKPRYTGNFAWRAVVPMDRLGQLVPPPSGCVWVGEGKHAVTTRVRSGTLANFVGIVERPDWTEESWSAEGSKAGALQDFGDWHPVLRGLIENADSMFRWGLFDRAPLQKWSDGRVVLLGDAAHAMLPSMAQGAVQAFEDAYVLAGHLRENSDVAAACQAYYKARIARASQIQARSSRNLSLFHRRGAIARVGTFAPMWLAGRMAPGALLAPLDWIYGHDVTGTEP